MLIIGSTVSETLARFRRVTFARYDLKTGALRWSFHTIPHPGEFGYETWPADAYKVNGGANAWSGRDGRSQAGDGLLRPRDRLRSTSMGRIELATNLFANTLLAPRCEKPASEFWHFQGGEARSVGS